MIQAHPLQKKMMTTIQRRLTKLAIGIFLSFMISCGNNDGPASNNDSDIEIENNTPQNTERQGRSNNQKSQKEGSKTQSTNPSDIQAPPVPTDNNKQLEYILGNETLNTFTGLNKHSGGTDLIKGFITTLDETKKKELYQLFQSFPDGKEGSYFRTSLAEKFNQWGSYFRAQSALGYSKIEIHESGCSATGTNYRATKQDKKRINRIAEILLPEKEKAYLNLSPEKKFNVVFRSIDLSSPLMTPQEVNEKRKKLEQLLASLSKEMQLLFFNVAGNGKYEPMVPTSHQSTVDHRKLLIDSIQSLQSDSSEENLQKVKSILEKTHALYKKEYDRIKEYWT